jgi:hypothetical protein
VSAIGNAVSSIAAGRPPSIQCTRDSPVAVTQGIPLEDELVRFPK